jgi:hypothetical protein
VDEIGVGGVQIVTNDNHILIFGSHRLSELGPTLIVLHKHNTKYEEKGKINREKREALRVHLEDLRWRSRQGVPS